MGGSKKKKKQQLDSVEFEQVNDDIVEKEEEEEETKKKNEESLNVKMQRVNAEADKISPIIGYFPSGFDPCKGEEEEECSVDVYQSVKRNNRYQVVVRPNEGGSNVNVNFVGTNYSGEGALPHICTYALGVFDKHTHTLSILPITANKIFRLEPYFGESDATEDEAQQNLKDQVSREENRQKQRLRDNMFSTKKTITKNKKYDSLHHGQDLRSKEDMEKSLEDVKFNPEALAAGSTNARNIPFHDMSASTPEKVYPLEKIVEKGEWDYLSDLLNISQGGEVTLDSYPIFVCNRVQKLKDIKDEYEKSTVAGVLQYITHLIKYKDKHSMDHYKPVKNHKFPSILEEKFRTMFNEPGSKRLSPEKRKFLISHILVLTLFVDGYRSDLSDIAKDLKMGEFDLRKYYSELGCKLVREKSTVFATLPVPLTFPVLRPKKRKR